MGILQWLSAKLGIGGISVKSFDVTDGAITSAPGGLLRVSTPEMRAVLKTLTVQKVTTRFTYLGVTSAVSYLSDGTVRYQFGLKLKAQDPCNLVYVMWHFGKAGVDNLIEVSVKSNPGKATSDACGDAGYIFSFPGHTESPAPFVQANSTHTLEAELAGQALVVHADGKTVWQGTMPPAISGLVGPVGVRSDNAQVVFNYIVG